jgi:His/Glu/Gln/Arg/opine family amino acid ABC transporter permease subunit
MASFMINVELIKIALPHLLHGALISLAIAFCSLLIGFFGGTLLGIIQTSKHSLGQIFVTGYVTLIRGTPMLIQIFFLYYLVSVAGLHISPLWVAVLAIGINSSAYMSQIIKAGILSVSKGQLEAAKTLGIRRRDLLRYVILPQALSVVLPALGNEAITLIKDSSLASLIGVMELYKEGQIVMSQTYDALTVYFAIAMIYLSMTTTLSFAVHQLEHYLK